MTMVGEIEDLKSELGRRRDQLAYLIDAHHLELAIHIPAETHLEAKALLAALAWQESTFGLEGGKARVEPAYRPGGGLHRDHVAELWGIYGAAAAASWSSWQIMFPTAWELGFRGRPWDLWADSIALPLIIRYLDVRAFQRGAATLADVARAYNGGNPQSMRVPDSYIMGLTEHYDAMLARIAKGEPLGP